MKKTILSLGKALSKQEQRQLKGGHCGERPDPFCIEYGPCVTDCDCCFWEVCSPWVNGGGICN